MNSDTQVFFHFTLALRTFLRSSPSVNFSEELPSFPAHIFNNASELSKSSIKHMFPKHPLSTGAVIQVFHEDHITRVAKGVGLLVVKVLASVVDVVVKTRNLNALLLVVFRALLLSRQSALQQFQLALQLFKKLGWLYENTVTGCQEFLQSNINPNRVSMWGWVWNTNITLKTNRCVPSVNFPQDFHLLNRKPRRDGTMQVDWNGSNLGQLYVQVRYWVVLKLRKQQRLELPILLESRKAKTPFLKILPAYVQLLNGLLKNLRRHFTQLGEFLLSSW